MKVNKLNFGSITIDNNVYTHDIIIQNNNIMKRKKKKSKKYRDQYGHTPLSIDENIPWHCNKLVIGLGHNNSLPVMNKVIEKAKKMDIKLVMKNTKEAVKYINEKNTNFILHLTC